MIKNIKKSEKKFYSFKLKKKKILFKLNYANANIFEFF